MGVYVCVCVIIVTLYFIETTIDGRNECPLRQKNNSKVYLRNAYEITRHAIYETVMIVEEEE